MFASSSAASMSSASVASSKLEQNHDLLTKATMLLATGAGVVPPIHKQLKVSIQEGNEDKAIAIYMSKEGNKIHPSKPFPTKKVGAVGSQDTPLHVTSRYGLNKLFKLFLEYGGNPNLLNAKLENCAHCVCSASTFPMKRLEMLDIIYQWRGQHSIASDGSNLVEVVPIDARDIEGNTTLHLAARYGLLICIERLVERGAPLDVLNKLDLSCCETADRGEFLQIGLMLELAWLFQPSNPLPSVTGSVNSTCCWMIADAHGITIADVTQFMNDAIKYIADEFDETAARAEVLLRYAEWDVHRLKKELQMNLNQVLEAVKIKPRTGGYQKRARPNVGISVEDVYLDTSCISTTSFSVIGEDGNKKFFTFQPLDDRGKVGVYPANFDPSYRYIDQPSNIGSIDNDPGSLVAPLHVQMRKSEIVCQTCQKSMYERVGIQHFLHQTCTEPIKREIACSSGHRHCFSCWADSFQNQFNKNPESMHCLPCLHPDCGEILDFQWARILLSSENQVNQLLDQRQMKMLSQLGLKWCPVEDCGLLMRICGSSSPSESSNGLTVEDFYEGTPFQWHSDFIPKTVVCGHGHAFCAQCHHEAHAPCSCNELTTWQYWLRIAIRQADMIINKSSKNVTAEECAELSVLLTYPNAKNCQRCDTLVQKEFGCNAVICPKCSFKFCWTCMDDWSSCHTTDMHGKVQYCNRIPDGSNGDASVKSSGVKRHKVKQIARYYEHFMIHLESRLLEQQAKRDACERIADGLQSSVIGNTTWLQGNRVANPWIDHSIEANANIPFHHSKYRINQCNSLEVCPTIDDYCLEKDRVLEFIQTAFEELDKARLFLQWSYPFCLFEFDELFSPNPMPPEVTVHRNKTSGLRSSFEALQGSLELETEQLSNLIAKNRCRGTKHDITLQASNVRNKRQKLENLILYIYSLRMVDFVSSPEANCDLIETTSVPSDVASVAPTNNIQSSETDDMHFSERKVHVIDELIASSEPKEHDKTDEEKMSSSKSQPLPNIASGSEENSKSSPQRKKLLSKLSSEELVVLEEEEILPSKPKLQTTAKVLFKAGSQLNLLLEKVKLAEDRDKKKKKKKKIRRIQSLYVRQESLSDDEYYDDETETPSQFESQASCFESQVSQFEYPERHSIEDSKTEIPRNPSLSKDIDVVDPIVTEPTASGESVSELVPETMSASPVVEEGPVSAIGTIPIPAVTGTPSVPIPSPIPIASQSALQQPIVVEQRFIGAKKDPDEEALEHAILISKQEEEFGINMYDALTPDDEPVIQEYMIQGFTREESILIIFEHKVGKVSILAGQPITPAMPTLHKIPINVPTTLLFEDDENQIESLMARGYTREQAIEFLNYKRSRQQQPQQHQFHGSRSQSLSDNNLHVLLQSPSQQHPAVVHTRVGTMSNPTSPIPVLQQSMLYDDQSQEPNQVDDKSFLEILLSRGYSLEEAKAICRSSKSRTNTHASQAVVQETMMSAMYATHEENEVLQLMARGYTRDQAYQVMQQSVGNQPAHMIRTLNRSNSNLSMSMSQNLNNDLEVRRLVSVGYTPEQASQMVLNGNPPMSSTGELPYGQQSNIIQTDPYDNPRQLHRTPSAYQRLIPQQEAEYGINMYNSLTLADESEINRLVSMGYSRDDAVLFIFQYRFQQSPVFPPQQIPLTMIHTSPINHTVQQQQLHRSLSGMDLYPHPQEMYHVMVPSGGLHPSQYINGITYPASHENIEQYQHVPVGSLQAQNNAIQDGNSVKFATSKSKSGSPSHSKSHSPKNGDGSPNRVTQKKKSFRGENAEVFSNAANINTAEDEVLAQAIRISEEEAKRRNQTTAAQFYQGQQAPFHFQQPQQEPKKPFISRQSSGLFGSTASTHADTTTKLKYKSGDVKQLESMGFTKDQAVQALLQCNNDLKQAAELLLNSC